MSVRSGKETNRTPMELYKGYRVIKVTKIEYHRCLWDNKDPKKLEDGLNKVISDYLASQGIKDTSVEVRLCEEW